MMQLSWFTNGGFVLHKIAVGDQIYSAWFDEKGGLLDCERTTGGKTAHVPAKHKNVKAELQRIGKNCVKK